MPRRGDSSHMHEFPEGRRRSRSRVEDEDVVEVMKVRRNEGMSDVGDVGAQTLKKSKTFRARASQAFRSIKNVGKPGRRPSTTEIFSKPDSITPVARQSEDLAAHETVPRPATPSLSRRKSLQLSQFFTFSQSSRTPLAPSDVPAPPRPSSPAKAAHHSLPVFTNPLSPHSKRLRPSPSLEDCGDDPSAATSGGPPTLTKRKSFRRRISALELHHLFSRNSGQSPSPQEDFPDACMTEGESSEVLVDILPATESRAFSMDSSETACSSASSTTVAARPSIPRVNGVESEQDDDLEMRLDSLHFDSLHFDPDEF